MPWSLAGPTVSFQILEIKNALFLLSLVISLLSGTLGSSLCLFSQLNRYLLVDDEFCFELHDLIWSTSLDFLWGIIGFWLHTLYSDQGSEADLPCQLGIVYQCCQNFHFHSLTEREPTHLYIHQIFDFQKFWEFLYCSDILLIANVENAFVEIKAVTCR